MTSTVVEKKDEEWAVQLFRPLLKDLKIQVLEDQNIVFTSNYKAFLRNNMDRCVVVVKRFNFSKKDYKGVFIWQYNEENNVYALYIILNDNMYSKTNCNEVYRKAVSTHEFTHCTAAMMTLARLKTKDLIKNQQKRLAKRFHAIQESDIKNLMTDISLSMKDPCVDQLLAFPDSHFRTDDEEFDGKYSVLYRNLLFSYSLFTEYFDGAVQKQMEEFIKAKDVKAFKELVISKVKEISKEKRLDYNFVLTRVCKDFSERMWGKKQKNKVNKI